MGFWSRLLGAKGKDAAPRAGARSIGSSTPPPSPSAEDAFVELYMAEARRHPRVERVERGEGQEMMVRMWTAGSDSPSQAFLKNTFLETRESSPEDKLTAVHRLLSILDHADEELSWEEASERLVPVLRLDSFAGGAAPLVSRPFAPFLRVFIGVDQGATVAFLTREKLSSWNRSVETVLAEGSP